ncbi:MAG: hypothetical protein AAFN13_05060, partial [Bacteroidota bacterium]
KKSGMRMSPASPTMNAALGSLQRNEAAFIVGDAGLIRIPDFFRAHACTLFHGDAQVDHFDEGRTSHGFEHELRAVSADVLAGRQQSSVVPWTATLAVMGHMERALRLLAQDAAQDQTVR